MADVADTIKYTFEAIGNVFRHMLPGILIIGVAASAHPSWFDKVSIDKGEWLILLAAVSIVVGNIWLVFHRYFIQQIIDFVFYLLKIQGGPCKAPDTDYSLEVAKYVDNFFGNLKSKEALAQHIRFRTSSVVLMYIVSEVFIVFSLTSDENSFVCGNSNITLTVGIIGFASSVWQNIITRRIEGEVNANAISSPNN